MKSFVINKNDSGQRLDKFVSKVAPLMPYSLICKKIRTKDIKINKKRGEKSARLIENDIVEIYAEDKYFDSNKPKFTFEKASDNLDIIYEDKNILILNKKEGLLVHEDKTEYNDTLILRVQKYLYKKGEFNPEIENSFSPALANRIDRGTCGLVIAAKNSDALRIINKKIKDREITKQYICLADGIFNEKSGIITSYLSKDESKNKVEIHKIKQKDDKEIITGYEVLSETNGKSILKITLFTGRTHQIRAQLSAIGHPITGDKKYGKTSNKFRYQALCSYRLSFTFNTDGGLLEYLNKKNFELDKNKIWFLKKTEQ